MSGAAAFVAPIAPSALLDRISSTQGTILYRNASAWVALAPSTSGHFLQTQGAGANPQWAAASGAGLGDFSGPASSTDNEIVRFDGTGGKNGQTSGISIGDVASTNITIAPIAANNLTLAGGSGGGGVVLGQGANGSVTLNAVGTGRINFGVASTNYGTAQATGFYFASTGGAETATPASPVHAYSGTASVNVTQLLAEGRYEGYGAGLSMQSRTSSGGALVEMARVVADGAGAWNTTGATQIANLSFWTTNAGTPTKQATLTYLGNLLIGGTTDISGSGGLKVFGATAAASLTTGAFQCAGGGAFVKELVAGLGLWLVDGITAPSATVGYAKLFVDIADGDLKIIFGDGTTKTISIDT